MSSNHDHDHDHDQQSPEIEGNSRRATSIDFAGTVVTRTIISDDHDLKEQEKTHDAAKDASTSGETNETDMTQRDVEFQEVIPEKPKECTMTVVTDLSVYQGETLGERIDSFINEHPVVMFQKTWCLFSIDAQQFLIHQMRVSIHAIELDVHPQGRAIQNYLHDKTGHGTVPVIFVKGEFLGGFEDVNQLYATGQLQEQYLGDLTQADRCEEFLTKSNIGIEPLFWFPVTVNAHVVRLTGILTCLCSIVAAVAVHWVVWGRYISYALFFDFTLRLFAGAKLSVLGRIATLLASPLDPKPRHGRPKQFATMCGMMFSGLAALFFFLKFPNHDYVGTAFMGGLAVATGMEGFLDFCVGCVIFKYGIKLGIIRK